MIIIMQIVSTLILMEKKTLALMKIALAVNNMFIIIITIMILMIITIRRR